MNASRPLFPTVPGLGTALAILAGSALLGGCVGNPFVDAKIDPNSPVAADVARVTRQDGKFPTFAGIPKTPTDIRPLAQYGRDANAVLAASIFHYGEYTVRQAKEFMAGQGIKVRLTA